MLSRPTELFEPMLFFAFILHLSSQSKRFTLPAVTVTLGITSDYCQR